MKSEAEIGRQPEKKLGEDHSSRSHHPYGNYFAKLFLGLLVLIVLIPLFYVVYISFQTIDEYYKMLWPQTLRFSNYKNIILDPYFWRWTVN